MAAIVGGSFLVNKDISGAWLLVVNPEYTDANTAVTYEAQKYIFKQAKNPMYENQSYKDYETDKKLLEEKWTSKERSLSYFHYSIPYVETIEFKDNGVMIIHYESDELLLDRYMFYAYTAKNNQLTFSLVTDKETKYAISYKIDEKGNLKFENDTTSASIFADEFFGDFTFYTEKNLPQPTTASAK